MVSARLTEDEVKPPHPPLRTRTCSRACTSPRVGLDPERRTRPQPTGPAAVALSRGPGRPPGVAFTMTGVGRFGHAPVVRGRPGSGIEACWRGGTPGCCSVSRARSCSVWPSARSAVCCSSSRRGRRATEDAGQASTGSNHPPRKIAWRSRAVFACRACAIHARTRRSTSWSDTVPARQRSRRPRSRFRKRRTLSSGSRRTPGPTSTYPRNSAGSAAGWIRVFSGFPRESVRDHRARGRPDPRQGPRRRHGPSCGAHRTPQGRRRPRCGDQHARPGSGHRPREQSVREGDLRACPLGRQPDPRRGARSARSREQIDRHVRGRRLRGTTDRGPTIERWGRRLAAFVYLLPEPVCATGESDLLLRRGA